MQFSPEQNLLRESVREFAQKVLAPNAKRWDEEERFPREMLQEAAELGLLGLTIPREYGGAGGGVTELAILLEEVGRVDASVALAMLIHCGVATKGIWNLGDESVKRKYLPDLATGRRLAAFAQTEPDAGSDAPAMRTTAVRHGNEWILNGTKHFITNGGVADVYTVLAKTDPRKRGEGISIFVVERDFPGFRVAREIHKMGVRGSSFAEITFDDCRVPAENVLAMAPDAFKEMMTIFNSERIGNASLSLGIAQGAFDVALAYIQDRQVFGKSVSDFQGIQWTIADIGTTLEAARLLVYNAADRIDRNLPFIKEASMAKLFCNEMARRVTDEAIQLLGGFGYTREFPLERMARDARFAALGGGTPHIQRNVIAGQILGQKLPQVKPK